MASDARLRANAKYDAKNTIQYHIKLNKGTDADIIEILDAADNKQGLIKTAIREFAKENSGK